MGGFGEWTTPQYGGLDGSLEWNSSSFPFQLLRVPYSNGNSQVGRDGKFRGKMAFYFTENEVTLENIQVSPEFTPFWNVELDVSSWSHQKLMHKNSFLGFVLWCGAPGVFSG
jgi:hypothetical protein